MKIYRVASQPVATMWQVGNQATQLAVTQSQAGRYCSSKKVPQSIRMGGASSASKRSSKHPRPDCLWDDADSVEERLRGVVLSELTRHLGEPMTYARLRAAMDVRSSLEGDGRVRQAVIRRVLAASRRGRGDDAPPPRSPGAREDPDPEKTKEFLAEHLSYQVDLSANVDVASDMQHVVRLLAEVCETQTQVEELATEYLLSFGDGAHVVSQVLNPTGHQAAIPASHDVLLGWLVLGPSLLDALQAAAALDPAQLTSDLLRRACRTSLETLGAAAAADAEKTNSSRNVRLAELQWVGFDVDHTLVQYDVPRMYAIMYGAVLRHMRDKAEPGGAEAAVLAALPEVPDLDELALCATKGLVLDSELGLLVHLDAGLRVVFALKGSAVLCRAELSDAGYLGTPLDVETNGSRFKLLHTHFEQPLGLVLATVVDSLPEAQRDDATTRKMWVDAIVQSFVFAQSKFCDYGFESHLRPSNVAKVVAPRPELKAWLRDARKRGCGTFIVTNSDVGHTCSTMAAAYGPRWDSLFDVVVTDARKSKFFGPDCATAFAHPAADEAASVVAGDERRRRKNENARTTKAQMLSRGNVGALAAVLDSIRPVAGGKRPGVLYVGDHLPQDVVNPRRVPHWTTRAIVAPSRLCVLPRVPHQSAPMSVLGRSAQHNDVFLLP